MTPSSVRWPSLRDAVQAACSWHSTLLVPCGAQLHESFDALALAPVRIAQCRTDFSLSCGRGIAVAGRQLVGAGKLKLALRRGKSVGVRVVVRLRKDTTWPTSRGAVIARGRQVPQAVAGAGCAGQGPMLQSGERTGERIPAGAQGTMVQVAYAW
jgi:hypothetical protein